MGNSSSYPYCVTIDDVKKAAKRIEGQAYRTPIFTSASLNPSPDQCLFFKVEALQRTGSFKFRGAYNAVSSIADPKCKNDKKAASDAATESDDNTVHIITHSSGNHAQAIAKAVQLFNSSHSGDATAKMSATIVMPASTPSVKKQAVKAFGADIVEIQQNTREVKKEAIQELQAAHPTGTHFIHPSEDPRVIAGQGTVCLEVMEQMKQMGKSLDAVIIPVGGGGLAGGNAIALRSLLGDSVKIILAEPAALDDAKRSFTTGRLQLSHTTSIDEQVGSVADGLKTTLGPNSWAIIRDLVDDIMIVSEEEILRATKLVWERLKICIEPSAGVGVAVARSEEFAAEYGPDKGIHNVAVVLCGGNVDILKTSAKMQDMGL